MVTIIKKGRKGKTICLTCDRETKERRISTPEKGREERDPQTKKKNKTGGS